MVKKSPPYFSPVDGPGPEPHKFQFHLRSYLTPWCRRITFSLCVRQFVELRIDGVGVIEVAKVETHRHEEKHDGYDDHYDRYDHDVVHSKSKSVISLTQ